MKIGRTATIAGAILAAAHRGHCWGNLGHRTIAYLAEKHFTEQGTRYATELLGGEDISDAAIWADEFKNTEAGRYTGSWHFVDAQDSPPLRCDVQLDRDCATTSTTNNRTCIITAISNMTSQLLHHQHQHQHQHLHDHHHRLPDPPRARPNEAFKMLLHLVGDVHQPLHAEALARGGNDIAVLFGGAPANLHYVWDVAIPQIRNQKQRDEQEKGQEQEQEYERELEMAAARAWAERLFEAETVRLRLRGQRWKGWLQWARGSAGAGAGAGAGAFADDGDDDVVGDGDDDVTEPERWALQWAREANACVCKYVLREGPAALVGRELGGEYYEGAVLVVDELVAAAGRRLGWVVNALADGVAGGGGGGGCTGAVGAGLLPPRLEL